MSLRRKTTNRRRLLRTCYVCGRTFPTTADTPFMRQLYNVDGKKQKICYFCSETCKNSTYKHRFDGGCDVRKQKREQEYNAKRDPAVRREYNRQYYAANAERERARQKANYHAMTAADRDALNWYRRAKYYVDRGGEIRTARKYAYKDGMYTISELSELSGLSKDLIRRRICQRGWSVEDAMEIPPEPGGWNGRRMRKESEAVSCDQSKKGISGKA